MEGRRPNRDRCCPTFTEGYCCHQPKLPAVVSPPCVLPVSPTKPQDIRIKSLADWPFQPFFSFPFPPPHWIHRRLSHFSTLFSPIRTSSPHLLKEKLKESSLCFDSFLVYTSNEGLITLLSPHYIRLSFVQPPREEFLRGKKN